MLDIPLDTTVVLLYEVSTYTLLGLFPRTSLVPRHFQPPMDTPRRHAQRWICGTSPGLEYCTSALRKLSELKSRQCMEDHRARLLKEIDTHLSLQLANPSGNPYFMLLRQAASKAEIALQKTVYHTQRWP